jgi:lipopolysaccharide/colanic/teichoic acid biosynthesis glycosyltransferase
VAVNERLIRGSARQSKAVADAIVAMGLLFLSAPLMCAVAAILWRARGRAFRSEARSGVGGKPFDMYRFNIDRSNIAANAFDKWLEFTSISELPQLFNVMRGEMSLVGPRPETAEQVKRYSEWQKQRLEYKPGITGYAQLYGLRETSSSEEKARYDIRYPFGWSPLLDLTMILQTLWVIFRRGSKALLSIPRSSFESNAMLVNMEVSGANSSESSAD